MNTIKQLRLQIVLIPYEHAGCSSFLGFLGLDPSLSYYKNWLVGGMWIANYSWSGTKNLK